MYFAYGWPHTYDTGLGAGPDTEVVACLSTSEHLLLVCRGVVQVWSSGRHRLLLGEIWLRDAGEDGDSCISAAWQEDRRRLVLLVRRGAGSGGKGWLARGLVRVFERATLATCLGLFFDRRVLTTSEPPLPPDGEGARHPVCAAPVSRAGVVPPRRRGPAQGASSRAAPGGAL